MKQEWREKMSLKISPDTIEQAKALVETGDLVPGGMATLYKVKTGKECPLQGDDLLVACMTDDDDNEEFVQRVNTIAKDGYEIVGA